MKFVKKGKKKMTDLIKCPHCKKTMVPKVTRGQEGMHSRICPLCGKNVDSILDQDVSQITIKTSPKVGLIVIGILILLAIIALLAIC